MNPTYNDIEAPDSTTTIREELLVFRPTSLVGQVRNNCTRQKTLDVLTVVSFCMLLFIFSMIVAVSTYTSPLLSETNILISDSKETIDDLQEIIPKISETLELVDTVCNHPFAHEYCYGK